MKIIVGIGAIVVINLLIRAPSNAQEVDQIVGNWVGKGASCKSLKDFSDERILKITKKNVQFYESTCKIRSVKKSGDSLYVSTICESEGEAERKNITVDIVSHSEIKIKGGFAYVRCP